MSKRQRTGKRRQSKQDQHINAPTVEYDFTKQCSVCGQSPVWTCTGMCGPCTTGEADTLLP